MRSPLSSLIIFYIFYICFQIGLGNFYYNQPIVKNILAIRHQFYFLSFFLFLQLLDSPERIRQLLNWISVLAVAALFLGLINYFGPTVLTHKWAEGQKVRSGIVRGFLPGMPIISFAAIWELTKWIERASESSYSFASGWLLLGAHFFRQSRMRLFGVIAVLVGMLIYKKRFKHLFVTVLIALISITLVNFFLPENLILNLFSEAAENVSEGSGSWRGRLVQLEIDFKEFMKHPIVGSGTSAIRVDLQSGNKTLNYEMLYALAYKADLGYSHWIKAYGLVGLIWLLAFFFFLWRFLRNTVRFSGDSDKDVITFAMSYLIFLIGTLITLNHVMFPPGIVLVCLLAAICVRMWSCKNSS